LVFSNNLGWIGVDLGTHTVKLAQAVRTADGVRLGNAAVIQRPSPWSEADALALDEPDPSWPEILAALECGDFHGRDAACLLPMNACELRGLKVPPGDVDERRAMIASELADDEGEPTGQREFDYWELGGEKGIETADGFNVNVMSVTRPWIDQVADDCQRVRLDCWAIDGAPLAMTRAVGLASRYRENERVVAIDWGFSNTTLAVVGRGRTLYARRLHDCQFRNCLEAIGDALGVSRDHAQHLVALHGVTAPGDSADGATAGDPAIQTAITSAIAEVAASLVEQIERTVRFVEVQRRQQHPTSLWLMGGGASLRNIGPYLSAALDLPISIWNVPATRAADTNISAQEAALFGPALALSALAWRAA
jgi:type IV pilus assembly protein PilM